MLVVKGLTAASDSLMVHFESWLRSKSAAAELLENVILSNCFFDVFCPQILYVFLCCVGMSLTSGFTIE